MTMLQTILVSSRHSKTCIFKSKHIHQFLPLTKGHKVKSGHASPLFPQTSFCQLLQPCITSLSTEKYSNPRDACIITRSANKHTA